MLGLDRGFFYRCHGCTPAHGFAPVAGDALAHQFGNRFIDRTGVRFFLGDAKLGKHFDQCVRRNLELPGELVNSDFAHNYSNSRVRDGLTDVLRVLYSIRFNFRFRRFCIRTRGDRIA